MVQLPHPSSVVPVLFMQQGIRAQLKASREIFDLVQKIADVARGVEDDETRDALEQVMRELLATGKRLSEQATATGNQILDLTKSRVAE